MSYVLRIHLDAHSSFEIGQQVFFERQELIDRINDWKIVNRKAITQKSIV